MIRTPFGVPSAPVVFGRLAGSDVVFLPRHGSGHTIPPHRVNYRANLWALREAGVRQILAVAAVGGIHREMRPGRIAFPDQIVDYTWGRASTYFEEELTDVVHIDFTEPYCPHLRAQLIAAARRADLDAWEQGTYGATQGPRLETAAEIRRMARDGCDMVGMTGMPEAALARELELSYACCAVSVNWGAGLGRGPISGELIEANLRTGVTRVRRLIESLLPGLRDARPD